MDPHQIENLSLQLITALHIRLQHFEQVNKRYIEIFEESKHVDSALQGKVDGLEIELRVKSAYIEKLVQEKFMLQAQIDQLKRDNKELRGINQQGQNRIFELVELLGPHESVPELQVVTAEGATPADEVIKQLRDVIDVIDVAGLTNKIDLAAWQEMVNTQVAEWKKNPGKIATMPQEPTSKIESIGPHNAIWDIPDVINVFNKVVDYLVANTDKTPERLLKALHDNHKGYVRRGEELKHKDIYIDRLLYILLTLLEITKTAQLPDEMLKNLVAFIKLRLPVQPFPDPKFNAKCTPASDLQIRAQYLATTVPFAKPATEEQAFEKAADGFGKLVTALAKQGIQNQQEKGVEPQDAPTKKVILWRVGVGAIPTRNGENSLERGNRIAAMSDEEKHGYDDYLRQLWKEYGNTPRARAKAVAQIQAEEDARFPSKSVDTDLKPGDEVCLLNNPGEQGVVREPAKFAKAQPSWVVEWKDGKYPSAVETKLLSKLLTPAQVKAVAALQE